MNIFNSKNIIKKENLLKLQIILLLILLFCHISSLANPVNIREYLNGRFPAVYVLYLDSLDDLDAYEKEFVDLLEILPEQEQRSYIKEIYKEGFTIEKLERIRQWQEKIEKPFLNIAFPSQGELTVWNSPLYIFGKTETSPEAKVTVNNAEVDLFDHRTGNFLTLINIPEGEKTNLVIASSVGGEETKIERTVYYPRIWEEMPESPLAIHSTRMQPQVNQVLRIGDILQVMFQGSPGAEASFVIGDNGKEVLMEEINDSRLPMGGNGIYKGSYVITENDLLSVTEMVPQAITVTLRNDYEETNRELPGMVSFYSKDYLKIVEIINQQARIYKVLEDSFAFQGSTIGGDGLITELLSYYLLPGTLLEITGMSGNYLRTRLGTTNYLIHEGDVRDVKAKYQNNDRNISKIRITENREKATIFFDMEEGTPFIMEDGLDWIKFTLYGISGSQNISFEGESMIIKNIKAEPSFERNFTAISITLELYQSLAGFDYKWNNTGLEINIRKKPELLIQNPLQGLTIVIDPGHGGEYAGAVGPDDIHEKDVVLEIGKFLQSLLEGKGAKVLMTRNRDIEVGLYDRILLAIKSNADLFVSIHANAHAVGADAVNYHGHMTIFNYAYNEKLAENILDALVKRMGLPRARLWKRGDLIVLRHPEVPSVLIETAFMMHPEDNWYLLQPIFQREFAISIMEGIQEYFQEL